jgi:hypothetical protein
MTPQNSSGENRKKRGNPQNLKPFKKGQSGNPKGYPKGQRNFSTIFKEALRRIAEVKEMAPTDIEDAIHVKAIEKALKGDFFYYKELNERIHGKVTDKMDLTSKGKTLADLILAANNVKKRRTK